MKEEIYKTHQHNPPHLFRPNAKYFITGATYKKRHYLASSAAKEKAVEYMFKSFEHFGWKIEDWVLLNNHYHIMADAPEDACTLSSVINNFHKFSAIWVKKNLELGDYVAGGSTQLSQSKGQAKRGRIWYNYRDTCINYEGSYFSRLNYIWFNPVKHRYVTDPADWPFGSFVRRNEDGSSVDKIIENYPWDNVNVEDDF